MLNNELAKFQRLCSISLLTDDQGNHPTLCASYGHHKRCIALEPIMDMIADRIRAYHNQLHADMNVSGEFRREERHENREIAQLRQRLQDPRIGVEARRSIEQQIRRLEHMEHRQEREQGQQPQPYNAPSYTPPYTPPYNPNQYNRTIPYAPPPPPVRRFANQINPRFSNHNRFRPGVPIPPNVRDHRGMNVSGDTACWVGAEELRNMVFIDAPENLPMLVSGEDPMQVEGWFDSIKHMADRIAHAKVVKTLYTSVRAIVTNPQLQAYAAQAVLGPLGPKAVEVAHQMADIVQSARAGDTTAQNKIVALADASKNGNQAATQALLQAKQLNETIKAKEAGSPPALTPEEESQIEIDPQVGVPSANLTDQIQGWLYNRPYRTNEQVLADALSGRFPTVSLAIRQGWHDGLGFIATMQRRNLSPFGG